MVKISPQSCCCCPNTENLRRFGEDVYCEKCVGDEIEVCNECGASGEHDMGLIRGPVDFCGSCRSVESFISMEWEDGEPC